MISPKEIKLLVEYDRSLAELFGLIIFHCACRTTQNLSIHGYNQHIPLLKAIGYNINNNEEIILRDMKYDSNKQ